MFECAGEMINTRDPTLLYLFTGQLLLLKNVWRVTVCVCVCACVRACVCACVWLGSVNHTCKRIKGSLFLAGAAFSLKATLTGTQ